MEVHDDRSQNSLCVVRFPRFLKSKCPFRDVQLGPRFKHARIVKTFLKVGVPGGYLLRRWGHSTAAPAGILEVQEHRFRLRGTDEEIEPEWVLEGFCWVLLVRTVCRWDDAKDAVWMMCY